MPDFIPRRAALTMSFTIAPKPFESRKEFARRAVEEYAQKIAEIPAVDAEIVVRCADCKFQHSTRCPAEDAGFYYGDAGYCSLGEWRRPENGV